MIDALDHLWQSTSDLYERFGLSPSSTPPKSRRKFFMEEVGELIEASALEEDLPGHRQNGLCEEAADVIVTTLGLLQAHGVALHELEAAIQAVVDKNDAKTLDTHALVDGKITRKQKQEWQG